MQNVLAFLQAIHSAMNDEKKWENEFNSKLFFSHGKTNYGTKKLDKINKTCNNSGRIYL